MAPDGWEPQGGFDIPEDGPQPPTLAEYDLHDLLGRKVRFFCTRLGSYGMGGPGFFGMDIGKDDEKGKWLICRIWGADDWIHVNDVIMGEMSDNELSRVLMGKVVKEITVDQHSCRFVLGSNPDTVLEIKGDPSTRQRYLGSREARVFHPDDSLWDAWVVSDSMWIYV